MNKRVLVTSALVITLLPISLAGSELQDRANRAYQASAAPVQYRDDGRGYSYDYRRDPYATAQDYTYNRGGNGYEYRNAHRWRRSAEYVGGGAAAGALLGGIIGHGKGAAVGALAGGVGGYLYKKHKDRNFYGRGY